MANPGIKLVSPQDRDAHQSVSIPGYTPTGIFTSNHPDFGKPNFLQAEMCLERIESEKKRIGGILRAISMMLPQNEVLESLIWAAYKLHEDQTPLTNLRKALCLTGAEVAQ
ncbi:hypothetical protein [Achromobacter sp. NCFB-sbj8-Ac1-l]|uniref:hypothetical protein n=1 Tax=unclassified Achromobacter TaxID=2626865 RepID=UPI004046B3BB